MMLKFLPSVGLFSALFWILLFSISNATQCYFPDGTKSDYSLTCGSSSTYICCDAEDSTCASNLQLCSASGDYYIGACSNSTWPEADCPNYCHNSAENLPLSSSYQWVYYCAENIYCCGTSNSCCDGPTFTIGSLVGSTTSALPAPTTYTVLPSSGTTSSSGLSPGALAGSIIGPICAVLVAAIGLGKVYLNYRKRNPKSAAADHGAGEQKGSGGDPGGDPGADDNYDKTVDP